jgi:hypothetical protein
MDFTQGTVSLVKDEKRPTRRGPCAVKVARTVPTGGMERRVVRYRALSLPTQYDYLTDDEVTDELGHQLPNISYPGLDRR